MLAGEGHRGQVEQAITLAPEAGEQRSSGI